MKFVILSLILISSLNAVASRGTENCFQSRDAVPGQFIVFLEEGLDLEEKQDLVYYLGSLSLSVVNTLGADTLLVERTALSMLSRSEEKGIVSALNSLVGQGVEAVTCNKKVHALGF